MCAHRPAAPSSVVGLIPAAGFGSRLGGEGSKELAPVAGPEGGAEPPRPAITWLLEAMAAAGIERAYVVLRSGKWDIPQALAARPGSAPHLAFVVTEPTRSIPETVHRAEAFTRGREVLLGFPDVLFHPWTAARELLAERRRSGRDVDLGLFPSERPDKTDMVEVDGEMVTGFQIKPGPCGLHYTWLLATWGERFGRFLGDYLERSGGAPPPGSPLAELQMSQVLEAALADGLTIGARVFSEGRFIDIGTPEDLAQARRGDRGRRHGSAPGEDD